MTLFIVRHEHDDARCPARNPDLGAMLLNHLSRPNARRHGVEIKGDAVVQGAHTMYMILEAEDENSVRQFLAPFHEAGTVDIYPASTCARVVTSGGCAATASPDEASDVPAMDPEEACQHAIDAGLVVHRAHPLNCETSIPALIGGVVMPNAHFYVRNHFQIPTFDPKDWTLTVSGLVERPLLLSLRDLQNMPSQSMVVTLECAGNGRSALVPPAPGEQWRLGAVSTAEWTGVPLVEVLDRAGVMDGAREVLFRGADVGSVEGHSDPVHYERSLSIDDARETGGLLAYAMNGEEMPIQHGHPLRLVVPDWYGVASVKWLTEIDVIDWSFGGFFQVDRYVYERKHDGGTVTEPVTLQQVRALITEPRDQEQVEQGDFAIRGVAWSGVATIARVEVSVDGGPWQEARLVGETHRHRWQWWELLTCLETSGPVELRARATDVAGRSQPEEPTWNRLGYGNNSIQPVVVYCR